MLHDEKSHMPKDLLVLHNSSIEQITLNIKEDFCEKPYAVLSQKHPKIQCYCWF